MNSIESKQIEKQNDCVTNSVGIEKSYVNLINSIDSKILEKGAFLNVSERYYEHKYCSRVPKLEETIYQRVGFHSNRVCLLSLAEDHPIMKDDKNILRINFKVNDKIDRLQNKVSGKSKRGAQKLRRDSIMCYIECNNDEIYPVYSCVDGKLLEINEKLIDDPNLLKKRPVSEGYIALLLPILSMYNDLKNCMLTKEQYFNR